MRRNDGSGKGSGGCGPQGRQVDPAGELEADIRRWINEWNKSPKPFVWTKPADEILDTLATYCRRINDSEH